MVSAGAARRLVHQRTIRRPRPSSFRDAQFHPSRVCTQVTTTLSPSWAMPCGSTSRRHHKVLTSVFADGVGRHGSVWRPITSDRRIQRKSSTFQRAAWRRGERPLNPLASYWSTQPKYGLLAETPCTSLNPSPNVTRRANTASSYPRWQQGRRAWGRGTRRVLRKRR